MVITPSLITINAVLQTQSVYPVDNNQLLGDATHAYRYLYLIDSGDSLPKRIHVYCGSVTAVAP